jgi:integrase/recombinase XerD
MGCFGRVKIRGRCLKIRLKYLSEDPDRHGNIRLYVRVPGRFKVRLREKFGTDEFMASYNAAVAGQSTGVRQAKAAKQGSFRHLCQLYYASATFAALDISTQSWRRRALDLICQSHAEHPIAMMASKHVRRLRDELRSTPAAANARVKALKALFVWANEEEHVEHDPTIGVKKVKYATRGFHSWTADEIEQYKARHPLGTRARLAFDLLRFTTGRREDAVRFGPQHTRNGRVQFIQAKNEHRDPVDIDIPIHPDLQTSIDATPSRHLTFLVTAYGKPYTPNGFGNAVRDWCNQADLPHCTAHGLRKASPKLMAEEGATTHELMSVTGHKTLEQVEVYTRAANRAKLADSAMAKLKG